MKRLFKFLANRKGSAFIETLMVYVCVALIGVAVVGVLGKTIKDAAAGSPYQDEIAVEVENSNNNNNNNDNNNSNPITVEISVIALDADYLFSITYEEGMTWGEWFESEYFNESGWYSDFDVVNKSGSLTTPGGHVLAESEGGDLVAYNDVIDPTRDYFEW